MKIYGCKSKLKLLDLALDIQPEEVMDVIWRRIQDEARTPDYAGIAGFLGMEPSSVIPGLKYPTNLLEDISSSQENFEFFRIENFLRDSASN